MIQSFACKHTEELFTTGNCHRDWKSFQSVAERKLGMLNDAHQLSDLGSPPGNKLKALQANRKGQHSIRINDQYRVCFVWTPSGPADVEIVDYH